MNTQMPAAELDRPPTLPVPAELSAFERAVVERLDLIRAALLALRLEQGDSRGVLR